MGARSNVRNKKNPRAIFSCSRVSDHVGFRKPAGGPQSWLFVQLYHPSFEPFPGFDSVVFAKAASEKLASVGEICDARFVYVFTKDGSLPTKKILGKLPGKNSRTMTETRRLVFILSLLLEK